MTPNPNDQIWDVLIIGGGIAGLTASIYLAQAGQSVVLLEKNKNVGGRAVSTKMGDACVNLGAHALNKSTLPILQEVGIVPTGSVPKLPGSFIFEGINGGNKAVQLPNLLLGSFLKWNEKTELLGFYSRIRKTNTSALHNVTLQTYLESQISSPRVTSILLAFVRLATYCDASDQQSAGAVIEQLNQSQVLYIDGGWQSLVNQLIEQAQQAGVTIITGSPAREISGSYPRMTVSLKDGSQLTTRYVISTAGPTDTLALITPALTSAEAATYEHFVPVRAACLDLVVSRLPQPKMKFVLGVDYPLYFSNHSTVASFSENPSHSVVHLMKYLSPFKNSDPKQDEQEIKDFLDFIQPGWRKYVVQQRFLPRMLVSHSFVTAANSGLSGRPGSAVKGRPGLYVAGDWVGSEGILLNASLASAKEAARSIIASKEQNKEVIHCGI